MDDMESRNWDAVIKGIEEVSDQVESLGEGQPTLRDQFAMAALTGILSKLGINVNDREMASYAYVFADAMLKERAKVRE